MILYSRAQRIFDSYVAAKANLLPADFIGSGVLPTAWYDAELAELDADDQSWRAREPHIPPITPRMFEAPLTGTIGKPIPPGAGQVWNIPAINALPTTNPDPSRTIIVSPAQMLQDDKPISPSPTGLNSNPTRTTLMGIDVIVSNSIEPGQAAILPGPVPSGMLTPEHIAAAKAYLEGHSGPHGT